MIPLQTVLDALRGDLTPDLRRALEGADWQENTIGWSGVTVFRLAGRGYVKLAQRGDHDLRPERDRLLWLAGKLAVPQVLGYTENDTFQLMLLSEITGLPSFDDTFADRRAQIVTLLAESLHWIHALDVRDCPFDRRADVLIAAAEANQAAGRVEVDRFSPPWHGRDPETLLVELRARRPESEDLVVAHGDYCLPNILVDPATCSLSGFIDWGGAGVADRYLDLALCARSLTFNFGEEWVAPFIAAYGIAQPDAERIAFYRLADEFS